MKKKKVLLALKVLGIAIGAVAVLAYLTLLLELIYANC